MLKGRYTAVIISVFAHLFLILLLIKLSSDRQKKIISFVEKKAIKSYLYRPIIIDIKNEMVTKKKKKSGVKTSSHDTANEAVSQKVISQKNVSKKVMKKAPTQTTFVSPLPLKSFSPQESLARLRNSINQQVVNDAFKEHRQPRTATVMDGEQIPVPHSIVPLTAEEKHKQNTSTSNINRITKHDNGTCTIVREQMVGSDLEGSVSSFACGESNFDKSFREHMEKVRSKLVPSRKNR